MTPRGHTQHAPDQCISCSSWRLVTEAQSQTAPAGSAPCAHCRCLLTPSDTKAESASRFKVGKAQQNNLRRLGIGRSRHYHRINVSNSIKMLAVQSDIVAGGRYDASPLRTFVSIEFVSLYIGRHQGSGQHSDEDAKCGRKSCDDSKRGRNLHCHVYLNTADN